ncbi:MAG: S-layer homology domain-containing protein, partial [Acidobacteria bacterium]|nr:S-layer homology domain-containing protein [Acidobacteriota bacterium]
ITKGCNPPANDQFCPGDQVTRGQMAAFLVRALGLTDDGGGEQFDDDDGSIFELDIAKLAAAGITKGCNPPTNNQFCPNDKVTRAQMAAFLVRALGLTDDGGGNVFTDDDGSIFETDIAKLAAAGITKGCNPPTNDQFCPDNIVTREQMAAFLRRALDT